MRRLEYKLLLSWGSPNRQRARLRIDTSGWGVNLGSLFDKLYKLFSRGLVYIVYH